MEVREGEGEQRIRDLYLAALLALRKELEELTILYDTGVIPQHVYLDMRNELHRERGAQLSPDRQAQSKMVEEQSIVLRLETALIRSLQEKNWAARLLSTYQNTRLAEHLERDTAHILVCESVLKMLREREDLHNGARWTLAAAYEARLAHHRKRVEEIRREFPDFYRRFESRLASQATLTSAMRHARHGLHHGEVGTKVYNIIERFIAYQARTSIATAARYNA